MRANADGVANSIKGYFSYMNSMNKLSQFYNAATC